MLMIGAFHSGVCMETLNNVTKRYYDNLKCINAVYPPTDYLTFGPWIYLVPPFKPNNFLILGFSGGTVAGLTRLLYGDVNITGVDINPCDNLYNVNFVQADAREFVKDCGYYDAVAVDLYPVDSPFVCDFISSEEFVTNLARITPFVAINTTNNPDLSAYAPFQYLGHNKPARLANKIHYFLEKGRDWKSLFPL